MLVVVWRDMLLNFIMAMRWFGADFVGWLLISFVDFVCPAYLIESMLGARGVTLFCAGVSACLMWGGGRAKMAHALFLPAVVLVFALAALFWLIACQQFEFLGNRFLFLAAMLTCPVYLLHDDIGYMFMTRLAALSFAPALCILLLVAGVWLAANAAHLYLERLLSTVFKRGVAGG